MISILASLIYLIYNSTGLKNIISINDNILFFIIFMLPIVFSISQYKISQLHKDIIKVKKDIFNLENDVKGNIMELNNLNTVI